MYQWTDGTYISHHGILGQKWGVRRYQNPDGSLTNAGKTRYKNVVLTSKEKRWAKAKHQPSSFKSSVLSGVYMKKKDAGKSTDKIEKRLLKSNEEDAKKWKESKNKAAAYNKLSKEERDRADKQAKLKKAIIIGGVLVATGLGKKTINVGVKVAAAGLVTYGALKVTDILTGKEYTKTVETGIRSTEKIIKKYSNEIYKKYEDESKEKKQKAMKSINTK